MSIAYGFAGLAFGFFAVWRFFMGPPKRHKFPCFTLHNMNEYCGVHDFDLKGVKKGTKSAIVINDNTSIVENTIFFRGVGGDIFSRLNSHIANNYEKFLVFYRTEKNCYYLIGDAIRVGNYWAEIVENEIVYVFPMIFTGDNLWRKLYMCRSI